MSQGGASVRVTIQALQELRAEVEAQVAEAERSANQALHRAGTPTGIPELNEAIQGFARAWGRQMEQLARAGRELCAAIDHAAQSYQDVDQGLARMLTPGGGGSSAPEADAPTNPALRSFAGEPQQ